MNTDKPTLYRNGEPLTSSDLLKSAMAFANLGYAIFPCLPGKKSPATDHGHKNASCDREQIASWWTRLPEANIGLSTAGMVVIDIDGENNTWLADQPDRLAGLEAAPCSMTPRGGRHFYFRQPEGVDIRCSVGKLAPQVDVRANGGYIIAPPSVFDGKQYRWQDNASLDRSLSELPAPPTWLLDQILALHVKAKSPPIPNADPESGDIDPPDMTNRERRCIAFIQKLPDAISGQGGHDATLRAACECFRFGLDEATTWRVMQHFNAMKTGNEPWTDGELEHKIASARSKVASAGETGLRLRVHTSTSVSNAPTRPRPSSNPLATNSDGASSGFEEGQNLAIIESAEPMRLAEHYLEHRRTQWGQLTLMRYAGSWWEYFQGGFRQLQDEALNAGIYQHVDRLWTPVRDRQTTNPTGKLKKIVAKRSTVAEVVDAIPACGAIVSGGMPQWLDGRESPHPSNVIAFQNGLLDSSAWCRGETGLLPPTPLWFAGQACPFAFDAQAACPHWHSFLDQTFDGDPATINLLQEWFGVNLVPDNSDEKFMLFVGPPRSGKGTVIEVLTAMLGAEQVAITTFSKMASRFGLAPLVGKLAAILPDAHIGSSTDAKVALEAIKSITGNDLQAIDRKGIAEIPQARLYCRFTVAVNELPRLPDEAGAIKTRLLLIHFPNSRAGHEDITLKARLRTEAPGVAAWALEGLRRKRDQQRFTTPTNSADMITEFEKTLSPILSFLDDRCEIESSSADIWIEKNELYKAWCEWSTERGDKPSNKSDFSQSLLNANKGIISAKRGPKGAQFPVYLGVRLCS